LFCAIDFAASGGSGTLADDKADLDKEVRKFLAQLPQFWPYYDIF